MFVRDSEDRRRRVALLVNLSFDAATAWRLVLDREPAQSFVADEEGIWQDVDPETPIPARSARLVQWTL